MPNYKDLVKEIIRETCTHWLVTDEKELDRVSSELEIKLKKLNGDIRENGEKLCPRCKEPYITYTCDEYFLCNSCDYTWT